VEKPLALRRDVASRLREGAAQYGEASRAVHGSGLSAQR